MKKLLTVVYACLYIIIVCSSCQNTPKEYEYDSTPYHDGEHYQGF